MTAPMTPEELDEPNHDGIDFALEQLCTFLGVDPHMVSWDAATETVDGDVRAVIGNIMRAKYGEDFDPKVGAGVAQTSGWQPIETALKDGTPILVDFGKYGIHRVIWDNPFDWGEGTKIWCVDDQKHGPYPLRGYSESDEAGWMPLPPPSNQGASK